MQASQHSKHFAITKWQHIRIVLGILIVCSGWGLQLQTAAQDSHLPSVQNAASHPA